MLPLQKSSSVTLLGQPKRRFEDREDEATIGSPQRDVGLR